MTSQALPAKPVIIIGAGRSGTNMLRDVLTRLDGIDTWPCDEINYIWRHGNRDDPTDELSPAQATPPVVDYIRSRFSRMAHSSSLVNFPVEQRFLVEKTCANSLRVPFVDKVFSEARYIFLLRDGRDVVASARERWKAPLDIPYLLAKARYVPTGDLPYYASRYFMNRLAKSRSTENSLPVWGPKFRDMKELSLECSLDQVCAYQWVRCVEQARNAFASMAPEKVLTIHYEDFVEQPVDVLQQITVFLGTNHHASAISQACSGVRKESVGKGRRSSQGVDKDLLRIMEDTLMSLGYT